MDSRHFDQFYFGTQYYRAPTPLPEEWEGDLENITRMGFDCVQLRLLWRQNERVRGVYDFSDVDRLMELAQAKGQKVIIKFMLENAPDYVFRDFGGAAVSPDGIPLDYTGNGAFYLGGHRPCYDNPQVMAHAVRYVQETVRRYRNHPNLMLWNIWNEPRIRTGECACEHSVRLYHQWLQEQFGTIENLNAFLGKAWDSFDSVMVPRTFRTYADMYLWRSWSHTALNNWLKPIRDAVVAEDGVHPVMAHVGCSNVVNDPVDDLTDDWCNARLFDSCGFYGTSLSVGEHFEKSSECSWPFLITARLYDCSPYFWVHELYPEWGDWCGHVAPSEFRYKVMSGIAGGAKGLVLWQYRAERLGHENDLSGVVNIDGTPKGVTYECEKMIAELKEVKEFIPRSKPVTDRIGILFDLPSDLIGTIESRTGNGEMLRPHNGCQPYMDALQGIFALCYELKLAPEIIDSRHLADKINGLDVLYLPEYFIVSEENTQVIRQFAQRGGRVIAEEGLALRKPNTWLNYPWPGNGLDELFGVQLEERVDSCKALHSWSFSLDGREIPNVGYAAALTPMSEDVEVLCRWSDGRPALTRKGECYYVGISLGCWSFYSQSEPVPDEGRGAAAKALLARLLADRIPLPQLPEPIYVRKLQAGDEIRYVVFNRSVEPVTFQLEGKSITLQGHDSRIMAL